MTTARYIALLRGINVGRAKRVAMADLRQLLADLGYADVKSVLNSGNLVFSADLRSAAIAATAIEEAMVLKLGVAARVMVLGCDELASIMAHNSLQSLVTDPSRLQVFVLADAAAHAAVLPLCAEDWGNEALALGPHAAYAWCPDGMMASRAAAALGKLLGDQTTSRNWATLSKLQTLCASA